LFVCIFNFLLPLVVNTDVQRRGQSYVTLVENLGPPLINRSVAARQFRFDTCVDHGKY